MLKKTTLKSFISILLVLGLCFCLGACAGSTTSQDPEQWQPTIKNCWCCALYGNVFQVINNFVSKAIIATIPAARLMLGLGLLFVMLQRIGSTMLFMPEQKVLEVWKELGIVFLKAIFVAALLYNSQAFLDALRDYVIYPIGGFFVMMSGAVLDSVPGGNKYFPGIVGITPNMKGIVASGQDGIAVQTMTDSIFGDLGIQVQYIVSRIFSALKSGIPLMLRVVANGGFFSRLIGLTILYELIGLIILFPVAFVDAFILVGFNLVFLPICVVLWVFPLKKQSRYLAQVLFPQLLASFIDILFGCIVVVLMMTLLQVYTDISLDGILRETAQASNAATASSFSNGKPSALIFLVLIMAVKRIALEIGSFTEYFTGVKKELSIFKEIEKTKEALRKAAVAIAELAAMVVTGGASAAGSVARRAAVEAAKKAAADVASKAAEKASGGGSSGGGAS